MQCCEYFMNCPSLTPESPSVASPLPWLTAPSGTLFFLSCVSAEVRSVQSPQLLPRFRNPASSLFPGLFHSSGSFPKELFISLRFSGLFLQEKDYRDANFVPLVLLDDFIVIPSLKAFVTKVSLPGTVTFILQP